MISQSSLSILILSSPLAFLLVGLLAFFQPSQKITWLKKVTLAAAVINSIAAGIGAFLVFKFGLLESTFFELAGLGLSFRLDAVSIIMSGMIALLSFIIIKFSINYLEGDDSHGLFIGRLAFTFASVQLLVLSGNLAVLFIAWVLTSISLHQLLVFYPQRIGALVAARKKFIIARLGDTALLLAALFLYNTFGTGNLELIFEAIRQQKAGEIGFNIELAALFLVLAALLKSAQFPTHGWLIEIMETPTPVSALLHAGILNAGPFLIIRMAFVVNVSSYASITLLLIGGFTALFASAAFLTQNAIKTSLGYSSVAHMGFSLFVCGLGVFPAAMLHMVAHSFYKAHAFLSTGSVIDVVKVKRIVTPSRLKQTIRIFLGILAAFAIYMAFVFMWGLDFEKDFSLIAIGLVIAMGMSRLFAVSIDTKFSFSLFSKGLLMVLALVSSFFILESLSHYILVNQVPEMRILSLLEKLLLALILTIFAFVVFVQILAPDLSNKPRAKALAVHLKNGFYANAIFDRLIGTLKIKAAKKINR